MSTPSSISHSAVDCGGTNIQRKITPWKAMMRDAVGGDLAGGSSGHERSAARERAHPDLIVIGSLVDRLPNLGTFLFLVPELFSI